MVSKRKDNIPTHPEGAFEWLLGPKSTFRLQLEIGVCRPGVTPLTSEKFPPAARLVVQN